MVGSATSTSFASRGRSMITALPMPSETGRAVASLVITEITGVRSSAMAGCAVEEASTARAVAIANVRIRVSFAMKRFLPALFLDRLRGYAEADHVDAATLAVVRVVAALAGIDHAAQRERHRAGLSAERQRFSLARAQFERRRLADDDFLAVLVLDRKSVV